MTLLKTHQVLFPRRLCQDTSVSQDICTRDYCAGFRLLVAAIEQYEVTGMQRLKGFTGSSCEKQSTLQLHLRVCNISVVSIQATSSKSK